jgi:hypothetical protein
MRKLFNIDQDEKNRILEMHENAAKRHYLNEYSGVAFGDEQNGLKFEKVETKEQKQSVVPTDEVKYKNLMDKVKNFIPFDSRQLKDTLSKLQVPNLPERELDGIFKNFNPVLELVKKINPNGYKQAYESEYQNYYSITTIPNGKVGGMNLVFQYMIYDLLNMQAALRNKANELSGYASNPPDWAKTDRGKEIVDNIANQIGLTKVS